MTVRQFARARWTSAAATEVVAKFVQLLTIEVRHRPVRKRIAAPGNEIGPIARDKNFTEAKMARRLERTDESITRYLSQLETADRQAAGGLDVPAAEITRLKAKVAALKEGTARLNAINTLLRTTNTSRARSMATSGKDTGIDRQKLAGNRTESRGTQQAPVGTRHLRTFQPLGTISATGQ